MNCLISINSAFLQAAKTMLFSLAMNNNDSLDIYLLCNGYLESKYVDELGEFIERECKGKLYTVTVDNKIFNEAPIFPPFTIEIYYRLLAQSLLPDNLDRILWLDADIIVNRDIKELYNIDFEDNYIVACQARGNSNLLIRKHVKDLGLPDQHVYFNSGVILFNLDLIRKNISDKLIFDYIQNNQKVLKWPDQDVLNFIYKDKIKYCDYKKYNNQIMSYDKLSYESKIELNRSAAIIHYFGPTKPWNYRYVGIGKKIYWRYNRKCITKSKIIRFYLLCFYFNVLIYIPRKLKGFFKLIRNKYNDI